MGESAMEGLALEKEEDGGGLWQHSLQVPKMQALDGQASEGTGLCLSVSALLEWKSAVKTSWEPTPYRAAGSTLLALSVV